MRENDFKIDYIGIAEALSQYYLQVPANQRDFAWETDEQVQDYLQDVSHAISKGNNIHFLGILMLIEKGNQTFEVADGQQRLATTTIILSIIRDYLVERGDMKRAETLEAEYLFKTDFTTAKETPKLALNDADNAYFRGAIVLNKKEAIAPITQSNKLLLSATKKIREHFENRKSQLGEEHFNEELIRWVAYLRNNVRVIAVKVSSAENAFLLFETLNDRGIDVTAADLVKNYLFQKSPTRIREAQNAWSTIITSLENISSKKSLTMELLRYTCCIRHGQTTDREVFNRIKGEINAENDAIILLTFIKDLSREYAAIRNIDSEKWKDYDRVVIKSLEAINILGVKQIRPLLLAVARFFPEAEAAIAFRKMVSWSVRFLIADVKGGRLDVAYATLANLIYKREIASAQVLRKKAENILISDSEFQSSFAVAKVSISKLARYYLRSLETTARQEKEPEFIPNESTEITLEHIMPKTVENDWAYYINEENIESHHSRIGNMVLLQSKKNLKLGAAEFSKKIATYKKSAFLLTSQVGELSNWNISEIENRQRILAELAVKTWPL
ncbi:MAG TPA: DUF262 domain-containing protein [Chitinophagaceae bacterium]|nr:DUF262 domain-containing protein [Chitinophagaceae bacterium]